MPHKAQFFYKQLGLHWGFDAAQYIDNRIQRLGRSHVEHPVQLVANHVQRERLKFIGIVHLSVSSNSWRSRLFSGSTLKCDSSVKRSSSRISHGTDVEFRPFLFRRDAACALSKKPSRLSAFT